MKGLPKLSVKLCAMLLCIFLPFSIANAFHANYNTPNLAKNSKEAFDGFYLGAEAGWLRTQDNEDFTFEGEGGAFPLLVQNDLLGGIFFGYGHPVGLYYYIGLQMEMLWHSGGRVGDIIGIGQINDNGGVFISRAFVLEHMINLVLTPGFFISPATLFYFRFGLTLATLKFHRIQEGLPAPDTSDDSLFRGGLNIGAGIRHAINDHFAILAEANYYTWAQATIFGNGFIDINGVKQEVPPTETKARVHAFSILFGALYGFAI